MSESLLVEFAEENQEVQFERPITGVSINGQKLSDVHDLTQKVVGMTKTIKVLAITALTLCVMAVSMAVFTTHWLLSHEASIKKLLLTSSTDYNKMVDQAAAWNSHQRHRAYVHLQEFQGLHWDEGMQDWVNHTMAKAKTGNHRGVK